METITVVVPIAESIEAGSLLPDKFAIVIEFAEENPPKFKNDPPSIEGDWAQGASWSDHERQFSIWIPQP